MSKASSKQPTKKAAKPVPKRKSEYSQLELFGDDTAAQSVNPAADTRSIDDINADLQGLRIDDVHGISRDDSVSGSDAPPSELKSFHVSADAFRGDALASRLVRASAGTGKTYQLTARLLKILLQGAPPESVLATTFTRKAAGEILNRLMLALADAADERNEVALKALREQVGIPTLSRTVCVQLLDSILRNIHRMRICTLDSLFAQLARSFPFELGLPPTWRLTDEIEEVWLRERAVESVISALEPSEMMTLLSMLSKGDVKRSIAFELMQVINTAYGIQRQCEPKAWEQLKATKAPESDELTRTAGYFRQSNPPQASLQKKLDTLADLIEARQFDGLEKDTLISNIAKARRTQTELKLGQSKFPPGLDESFDVLYAAVRSKVLSLMQLQNEATGRVLAAYDHQITQLKQRSRALGFDDVAVRLANHFRKIDHESLANRMDGAINHVLLDEFQDTSPIQWQVLRPLAMRAAAPDPGPELKRGPEWRVERSFFCVGDTKQAIYGWRGGVAEIFDAVADQIDGVTTIEQNISFRSSPVILDVVDRTFMNLQRHEIASQAGSTDLTQKYTHVGDALVRFAKRFPRHEAHKKELAGHVTFRTSRAVDGTASDQANACFEDASELIADLHARAPEKSIGVLTRTNKSVAQLIFLLDAMGVDVSQEGGNPLVDSAAVDLVLSALMVAEHPGDKRWAFHIASSPIGEALGDEAGDCVRSMFDDRGLSETVEYLSGVLAPKCDSRDTLRLKQLTQLAMNYQRNAAPRLRDFVRLVREKRIERPRSARVRVMTVHQAKGLEFDAVVLPELDGQLTRQVGGCVADVRELGEPPHGVSRSIQHKAWHFLPERWQRAFGNQVAGEMTEALCLLYVAMTRAKQALHMVMPPTRKADFTVKTPASLIYHALGCEADPTKGNVLLFQEGDEAWCESTRSKGEEPTEGAESSGLVAVSEPTAAKSIQFRSLPSQPRRNRLL